jgi:SAM-dependent methyltransferase
MATLSPMDSADPTDLVRRGYDAVSDRYRCDGAPDGQYAPWLASLHERLPADASVLDLGCGCGVPVARSLLRAGHDVTGTDLSEVQIRRARTLVTGVEPNWLGGDAEMCWEQADADSYRHWIEQAGLRVTAQEFIPEGDSGHALFWATRGTVRRQ